MRFGSAWALGSLSLAFLVAAIGCAQSDDGSRHENSNNGGSENNGGNDTQEQGGGKKSSGGGNTGEIVDPGPTGTSTSGDKVVPDDDKANPLITHPKCNVGECEDFEAKPFLGEGVSEDVPGKFGDPENYESGTICILEPQVSAGDKDGAMIPANWLRPRFRWRADGYDLFEIRIHTKVQKNDLVGYTTKTTWYLPIDKEKWLAATNNMAGAPLTVTVRALKKSGEGKPIGVKGDFHIAPVIATGALVFWTVKSAVVTADSSKLLGFRIDPTTGVDEGVAEQLTLSDLAWSGQIQENGAVLRGFYDKAATKPPISDGKVRCIGCHTTTPDGKGVVFSDDWPWAKAIASIEGNKKGSIPSYVGSGGQALMKMPWMGTQSMTEQHWKNGDRIIVTSWGTEAKSGDRNVAWFGLKIDENNPDADRIKYHSLAWINVESTASIPTNVTSNPDYDQTKLDARNNAVKSAQNKDWGLIPTGDRGASAVMPEFNHAGDKIVYVNTDYSPDGHPDYTATTATVKTVGYNNRQGGNGEALKGASDSNKLQYYPTYSEDDKFVAFTRAPKPDSKNPDGPYYNRHGEIMVVKSEGGEAIRLAANDPNQCGGDDVGRGIINSWPKWSPNAISAHGKKYYFLVFSSARKYADEFSKQFQLPASSLNVFKGLMDSSQLYLAAIVVDEASGDVKTYPAVYIWNQNRLASGGQGKGIEFSNLTPAWDAAELPPIQITEVPADIPR